MKKVVIMLSLLGLAACGRAKFEPVNYQCKIEGNLIMCPDGSQAELPKDGIDGKDGKDGSDGANGQDGQDGIDGADGQNGQDGKDGLDGSIVNVIDPCGDKPNAVDEIILQLENDVFLAWFKDVGLVVLNQNTMYQTTDSQKCLFSIINNQVVSQ